MSGRGDDGERPAWSAGGALRLPANAPPTMGEALLRAGADAARGVVYADGVDAGRFQSYTALAEDARRIIGGLRERGVRQGDPVVFQVDRGDDFIPLLWACFLGGHVAVPVTVTSVFSPDNANFLKLRNVWTMLGEPLLVADSAALDALGRALGGEPAACNLASPEDLRRGDPTVDLPEVDPEDVALLLFTSGSTGLPKGVVQRHANLRAMAAGTAQMNGFHAGDVTLNWMPLDHVGAIVFMSVLPVWLGASQVHVPTRLVVEQPLAWLALIDRYRGSISWAPNFAFDLVNKCEAELAEPRFDLSSMRFLVNAGEQVAAQTGRRFLEILERQRLPADALRPAFGMSETCSGVTWSSGLTRERLTDDLIYVPLGRPIPGAEIRIVDERGDLMREGEIGRFELRGPSVTSGYHQNPDKNAEAFSPDGWFRTGDLGFVRDGELHVTGRDKDELVVNGRNIPVHEIEAAVEAVDGVAVSYSCVFPVRAPGQPTEAMAVAFSPESDDTAAWGEVAVRVRRHLVRNVGLSPAFVIPLACAAMPRTSIGKIQRSSLRQAFEAGEFAGAIATYDAAPGTAGNAADLPASEIERRIAEIWRTVLGVPAAGRNDNFFDLGGHSLLLIKVHARLEGLFGDVPLSELFLHPSVAAQAAYFGGRAAGGEARAPEDPVRRSRIARRRGGARETDIAVIGMACRFPGADDPDQFWRNLCEGVESIRFFDRAELTGAVDPRSLGDPAYVPASPVLNDAAGFDAAFFGFSEKEAETMDPQHRLFLECCWEAMEAGGYDPLTWPGAIGLYAGASMNTYLVNNVLPNRGRFDPQDDLRTMTLDSMGGFQLMVANDKDYLNTRVSYKLNLRGPSLNIQTACSTGLVVIHQAVQSLIAGECDMALAGTSSVQSPQAIGHLYQEGMIVSPDGHCRAFDAAARGTIFGSGVGAVLLKRLSDAQRDGDLVLAVVKGSAINNDGLRKVGYMAPSEAGESDVVREALDVAGVDAASIGFVEAHGTGTAIGDPIEVASLTRAFRADTDATGFCALGSVKTNVGHLQISSGIAGFMKAVLAVRHGRIPATLHFERPNPAIDFARTPFRVNTEATAWPAGASPRRAGVNSLGIGGTNAHVILEEAPAVERAVPAVERPCHVLGLSARTPSALGLLIERYRARVAADPSLPLEDLCYTANTGRHAFPHRFAAVFATRAELVAQLSLPPEGGAAGSDAGGAAFLFTGQGAQYAGMARELYRIEPVFRSTLDLCAEILAEDLDRPLLDVIHPAEGAATPLDDTAYTQPALFAVEYALAKLWQSFGIAPAVLIGHSVGEYAAACVAGVFTLEEGLRLIAARGRLMQALPRDGSMTAVMADEATVSAALAPFADRVAVAAVNGPHSTVISGDAGTVAALAATFQTQGVQTVPLKTSHAFHSPLMRPILDAFRAEAETVQFRLPRIPVVSNVTGRIETDLLADPGYWVRHIVEPVRFMAGVQAAQAVGCATFVEVGPKPVLLGLIRGARDGAVDGPILLPSLRSGVGESRQMLESVASLFRAGHPVAWTALYDPAARRRIDLPTYPFEHRRFWLEPPRMSGAVAAEGPILHPLVHRRIRTPGLPQIVFETDLDPARLPLLDEHRVFGRIVVAGAGHLSMLLAASELAFGAGQCVLSDITFAEALVLPDDEGRRVQVQFLPAPAGQEVRLVSFPVQEETDEDGGGHKLHVTGLLGVVGEEEAAPTRDADAVRPRCGERIEGAAVYRRLADRRIDLGAAFSWLRTVWTGDGEALFEIEPPIGVAVDPAFQLHPGLIDSLLQPALAVLAMGEGDETYVPFAMEAFRFHRRVTDFPLQGHARRRLADGGREVADIAVYDADGACVAEVRGFEFRRADPALLLKSGGLRDALYEIVWREIEPGVAATPASEAIPLGAFMADRARLAAGMATLLEEVNGPHYREQADDLETLGLGYIVALLRDADALPAPGTTLSTAEICDRLGAAPRFRPFVGRILQVLEQHGRVFATGDRWEGWACPELPDVAAQTARIRRRHGERAAAELALLQRCGDALPAIVRGASDPLEALFPGGDLGPATRLYRDSAGFRALNLLVANAVAALVATIPAPAKVRILEIGAGTGATSHHVLPRLDPARSDYCFTDVSNLFLARARQSFPDYPFVDYRLLDIERDPAAQGIEGGYDIVIAANVLHATRDIGETLANVRRLLRPGGHLLLLEVNVPTVPVDLTFGLLEGWWRFADHGLRPDYPLLSRRQWLQQLAASGFGEAAAADVEVPTPGGLQSVVVARAGQAVAPSSGAWAILADRGGMGVALAAALEEAGQPCRLFSATDPGTGAARGPWRGIVHLAGLDGAADPDRPLQVECGRLVATVQALLRGTACPIHIVTRGAQQAGAEPVDPVQAALWGLGRVLFREHPELAGALVDLDPAEAPELSARRLADRLQRDTAEREVALRSEGTWVPRLTPAAPTVPAGAAPVQSDGTYLITGGLGGLGLRLARALLERGARHLVLVGRSAPDAAARDAIAAMAGAHVDLRIEQADVTDEAALQGLLERIAARAPLRGVFHLAGTLQETALHRLTEEDLDEATAAKVLGARHLDRLTRGLPLDMFVLFASAAGLLGLPGQGAYAASNAFLDALARLRRADGEPALAIDWGRWSEIGMVAGDAERLSREGFDPITPDDGMAILFDLIATDRSQIAVLPVRWERVLADVQPVPSLLADLRRGAARTVAAAPVAETRRNVAAVLPAVPTVADIRTYLAVQVRELLGTPADPEPAALLTELGLDSMMNIDLRNRIARDVGINLPLGALLEASIERLAVDLQARRGVAGADDTATDGELEEEILL